MFPVKASMYASTLISTQGREHFSFFTLNSNNTNIKIQTKMKQDQKAKMASAAISHVRKLSNFTLTEIRNELRKSGCPYPANVVSFLSAKGIIVKGEKTYNFISDEPVHYGALIDTLIEASASQKKYTLDYKCKKIKPDSVKLTSSELERMIKILKEKGYKVLKPVTNFEEV